MPLLEGQDVPLAGQQVRLTLLHTSDIHSRLVPYDFNPLRTDVDMGLIPEAGPFGGATRMAAIAKRERARAGRVLHLDSGDSFQGAPIFNLNAGEAEYRFLSLMGVDAAVIGNHEFDSGHFNFVRQAKEWARFPVLAANYQWEPVWQPGNNQAELYTSPYTIKNVGGLSVAIIGLANIGSLNSIIETPNSLQVVPLEQNEIVRNYVDFLRPSVDLVLLTSHAGLTEDQDLIEGYEAFYDWGTAKHFVNREYSPWQVLEWFGDQSRDDTLVRVLIPGVVGIDAILGGHLHVVLNPPQQLTDPSGRTVILSHGGAFSKYILRLDLVVDVGQKTDLNRAEILSHEFRVFPIDALWCNEELREYYKSKFWGVGEFIRDPKVQAGIEACKQQEDLPTTELMQPYLIGLDQRIPLTALFAYAPKDIARRNNSSGGDSPLGNIAADSMRLRRGVEAEIAVTNSLGIRDNLYAGPLTQESMFNVFPFENTINVMFLSGREVQELMDFIAERSQQRGCVSQAQVSGIRFNMDCAQAQLNFNRYPCTKGGDGSDCPQQERGGHAPWQCLDDTQTGGGRCWAHPGTDITVGSLPLDPNATYRVAVNDYIARGGSGFLVLKRNTTRVETGIPLRDSLIGYMQGFCTCQDLLAMNRDSYGNIIKASTQTPCGNRDALNPSRWLVDPLEVSFCQQAKTFQDQLNEKVDGCTCAQAFRKEHASCPASVTLEDGSKANIPFEERAAACVQRLPPGPVLGRCTCRDALARDPACGYLTAAVRNFCENPTLVPLASGIEDARITRSTQ